LICTGNKQPGSWKKHARTRSKVVRTGRKLTVTRNDHLATTNKWTVTRSD
jgi:hypothetical protein